MILTDFSKIKFGSADITAVYAGEEKVWPAETGNTTINMDINSGYTIKVVGYTADGTKYEEKPVIGVATTGYTCERYYKKIAFTLWNNVTGKRIGNIVPAFTKLLEFKEDDSTGYGLLTHFDFSRADFSEYDPSQDYFDDGNTWTMVRFNTKKEPQQKIFDVKVKGARGVDNFVNILTGKKATTIRPMSNCYRSGSDYLYFCPKTPALSIFGDWIKAVSLNGTELSLGVFQNATGDAESNTKMGYFPYTGTVSEGMEVELAATMYSDDANKDNRHLNCIIFGADMNLGKLSLGDIEVLDYNGFTVRIGSLAIGKEKPAFSIINYKADDEKNILADVGAWGMKGIAVNGQINVTSKPPELHYVYTEGDEIYDTAIKTTVSTKFRVKGKLRGRMEGGFYVGHQGGNEDDDDGRDFRLFMPFDTLKWMFDCGESRFTDVFGATKDGDLFDITCGNNYIINNLTQERQDGYVQTNIADVYIKLMLSFAYTNSLQIWQGEELVFDASVSDDLKFMNNLTGTAIENSNFLFI